MLNIKVMKSSIFTIIEKDHEFKLQLFDVNENLLLTSKGFSSFNKCQDFMATLRVHLCFQTNFSRCKNMSAEYGFEIRTCWDDLIASSEWFASREERSLAMEAVFRANKNAVFVHSNIFRKAADFRLEEVA